MDKGGVESVLQEMALSLPSVQEDDDAPDKELGEVEDDVPVFNRGNHLLSVGYLQTNLPLAVSSSKDPNLSQRVAEDGTHSMIGGGKESTANHIVVDSAKDTDCGVQTGEQCGTETAGHPIPDPGRELEWDRFKMGFMEQLEAGGHDLRSDTVDLSALNKLLSLVTDPDPTSTSSHHQGPGHEQLTQSFDATPCKQHTDTESEARSVGGSRSSSEPQISATASHLSSETKDGVGRSQPSRGGSERLLSTAKLATINMSALDMALKFLTVHGPSETASNIVSGEHSQPNMAWGEARESSPDLMSQLEALSSDQQSELAGAGEEREKPPNKTAKQSDSVSVITSNNPSKEESGEKTVYIDLRQPPESDTTHSNSQSKSVSESEESDDEMWAQRRREMKSLLSPSHQVLPQLEGGTVGQTTLDSPVFSPSQHELDEGREGSTQEMLHHTPNHTTSLSSQQVVAPLDCHEEPGPAHGWQTAESKKRRKKRHKKFAEKSESESSSIDRKLSDSGEEHSTTAMEHESLPEKHADVHNVHVCSTDPVADASGTSSESVLQSSSASSVQWEDPTNTFGIVEPSSETQNGHQSFALSSELSSFSEGEILPSKSISGETAELSSGDKKTSGPKKKRKRKSKGTGLPQAQKGVDSSPEMGRAEFGAEKEKAKEREEIEEDRKSIGTENKDRGGRKTDKSKKKKDGVKKKKIPVMRLRLDSLTTSSDEERGIDSSHLSQVEEVAELLPEKTAESEERLRQRLEHKILSKKPPALFETPSTESLFHKDVSFSPVITHVYPSASTDALLVLPLSAVHGLVSLPPSHPHISPEAHLDLHSLLLTSLAVSAAQCSLSSMVPTGRQAGRSSSPLHGSSKLPFRITALYQTVLDGQLAVLIGASLPQGRKRSMSYPSVVHQTQRKSRTPGSILSPLDTPRSPFVAELDGFLCRMRLRDFLGGIMESNPDDESTAKEVEKVVVSPEVRSELQPLLEMSAQAFFSVHPNTEQLTTPISFYWHSLYQLSLNLPSAKGLCTPEVLQATVCALPSDSLSNPSLVFQALHGAYDVGLSIAGMRLVYGEPCSPLDLPPSPSDTDDTITDFSSVSLVLCLRGPDAVSRCMDLVGPEDHSLACVTDPLSIVARFGRPWFQPALCVRTPFRVPAALARWFGGRGCLRTGTVLGMTDSHTRSERRKRQRVRFSESEFESEDNLPPPTPDISFPPLVPNRPLLTVCPYQEILLVASPLLPPLCYASILATCGHLGFDILGVKRVRLNSKRAAILNIPELFISHFTPSSTPPSPDLATFCGKHPLDVRSPLDIPPLPSLLLIVGRENALPLSCALKATIISSLKSLLSLNPQLEACVSVDHPLGALLHAAPYSPDKLKTLGSFSNVAVTSTSSLPQLDLEWEKQQDRYAEEISFIAVMQASGLTQAIDLLQLLFNVKTEKWNDRGSEDREMVDSAVLGEEDIGGFELLGIKLIPQLSRFHAKQLCPIQPTDHGYQEAIELLSDSPSLVLILRGIACNHRLQQLLTPSHITRSIVSHHSLSHHSLLTSGSLSQAFHHTTLFFTDKELFCDPENWPLLTAVPSNWARADVLADLQRPPQSLLSVLVMRGVEWRLLVKVVNRLHRAGFQVCGLTMTQQGREDETPYTSTNDSASQEVAVCVSRPNAVWYLSHELKPFISHKKNSNNKLHCPAVFADSVSLVKQYFPRGVCSEPLTTAYGVKAGLTDEFSGLRDALVTRPSTCSPLTEIMCLILPPSHLTPPQDHPTPQYLQLLELVVQAGFSITGLQLTHLSQSSAATLSTLSDVTFDCKALVSGPCLVMALQRDNAASCFHYILKSAADQRSVRGLGQGADLEELLGGVVVPDSARTAAAILAALIKEE